MKKLFLIILTVAFVLSLLPIRSTAATETWRSVRSKNFYLIGNASDREIRQVATKLEQFREGFSRLYPQANLASGVPVTVIVFKNSNSFSPYMPLYNGKIRSVAGYFQGGDEQNYILLTSDMSGDHPYSTIYHEFVHSLISDNASFPLPVWFNEGMSEVYSTFEVTGGDKKAVLGGPVSYHLRTLRDSQLIPLQRLFSVKYDSPEYNESNIDSIFYAESWALVHYLMLGNERKRQPQLGKFIELMASGVSMDDAFNQAFHTDYGSLQQELMNYVRRAAYSTQEIHFDEKLDFDKALTSAEISEAEGEFNLGNLLSIQKRAEAETHLLRAISIDPDMAEAQAVLGGLRMRQGKIDEAKQYLERAYSADSKSYLAHYYYALALSREGMKNDRYVSRYAKENVIKMRQALSKAIELNPRFVASYQLLGFINLVTNEQIDESISMLTKTLDYAPGRQNLHFVLGQLYLRKLNFEMARKIFEPIARNAEDQQSRANAREILAQIVELTEIARNEAPGIFVPGDIVLQNKGDARSIDTSESSALAVKKECGNFQGDHIKGLLFYVGCTKENITLYVRTDDQQVVKFQTSSLDKITAIACGNIRNAALECGTLQTMRPVTIYYRKSSDKDGIAGEPFAILMWP